LYQSGALPIAYSAMLSLTAFHEACSPDMPSALPQLSA